MRANIHPKTYTAHILCSSCGNKFQSLSTKEEVHVEVCHKCHPFYTGEQRFVDVRGRVQSFQKKQEQAAKFKEILKNKKSKKIQNQEKKPKSLKELLSEM